MSVEGLSKVLITLKKEREKQTKGLKKRIRSEAKYLAKMLHSEPARTRAKDTSKMKSGGVNYVALSKENLVWFPDPNGGKSWTDGTTVSEYLKRIKAGKTTEKSSFSTRRYSGKYKRSAGGKGFARTFGGNRVWETKKFGERYEKGTVRTSEKEKAFLKKQKARARELRRKLNAQEKRKCAKLENDIRRLERRAASQPSEKSNSKLTAKRARLQKQREMFKAQRKVKLDAIAKEKHYRIVGEIQSPTPRTFLRSVRPDIVRTWYGDGGPEKYLGRMWKVTEVNDLEINVSIHPLSPNERFLRNIEYGGSFDPSPVLIGYEVFIEDESSKGRKYKQRRVRFIPKKVDRQTARVKPRKMASKVVAKFREILKKERNNR